LGQHEDWSVLWHAYFLNLAQLILRVALVYRTFVIFGSFAKVHSERLKELLNWDTPVKVGAIASQLKCLAKNYALLLQAPESMAANSAQWDALSAAESADRAERRSLRNLVDFKVLFFLEIGPSHKNQTRTRAYNSSQYFKFF
jgi:hypothetical protein